MRHDRVLKFMIQENFGPVLVEHIIYDTKNIEVVVSLDNTLRSREVPFILFCIAEDVAHFYDKQVVVRSHYRGDKREIFYIQEMDMFFNRVDDGLAATEAKLIPMTDRQVMAHYNKMRKKDVTNS